jgi:hypothetical protein
MKKSNTVIRELLVYAAIVSRCVTGIFSWLWHFAHEMKGGLYAGMGKGQRRWFIFCNLFLSAYMTFILYLSHSRLLFTRTDKTIISLFYSVCVFLLIYNVIICLCLKYKCKAIAILGERTMVKKETVILFSCMQMVVLLLALAAAFPGGISPDTEDQWEQVHSFVFNDAHPVIHTLMIWLITRIVDHYAFVVFVQILVFSMGAGYLIATLESWGFDKKHLLIAALFIILNPYTMNIMMYPWKDLALTVLITWTMAMVINIYYSGGLWFKKPINVVLFAMVTGLASIVRHNGFFFTLPLYIIIFLLYSKQTFKVVLAISMAALIVFLVKVPLYKALNVTKPHRTYTESVGIPMTILGNTLVKTPGRLPPEAKNFLNRMASDEEWREKYIPGDYNSIKWKFQTSDIVKAVPPKTLMTWMAKTCINAKYEAFHAFCDVTAIVWKIDNRGVIITPPAPGHNNILSKTLHYCFLAYSVLCLVLPLVSSLFSNLGVQMLLLLLTGIFALCKTGTKALLLVIPSVAYNLGTMLLLCGEDIRFFHFNFVIAAPLLFVLLSKSTTEPAASIIGSR